MSVYTVRTNPYNCSAVEIKKVVCARFSFYNAAAAAAAAPFE